MEWIDTPESSNVSRIAYMEGVLYVEFKNGSTYQYFDVPEGIFEQLKSASSKGVFIGQTIKGTYRYARV